jgi:abhydrolase domain-containing protein 4/abhydrolase domain-containing protein 5
VKSDEDWRRAMEEQELVCYKLMGFEEEQLIRKYVEIEMDGKPFKVRVVTINEQCKGERQTLVLTHGYLGSTPTHLRILKGLSELYHLVLFDNCTWGLNTRDGDDSSMCLGADESEKWMADFMHRTFEAMDEHLPPKFLLIGHSFGGYLVSLYASQHIDRVEALCLISPLASSYIPETYNPARF